MTTKKELKTEVVGIRLTKSELAQINRVAAKIGIPTATAAGILLRKQLTRKRG